MTENLKLTKLKNEEMKKKNCLKMRKILKNIEKIRGIVGGRIKTQRGNFYSRFTDSVAGDCQEMMTCGDYSNFNRQSVRNANFH